MIQYENLSIDYLLMDYFKDYNIQDEDFIFEEVRVPDFIKREWSCKAISDRILDHNLKAIKKLIKLLKKMHYEKIETSMKIKGLNFCEKFFIVKEPHQIYRIDYESYQDDEKRLCYCMKLRKKKPKKTLN